MNVLPYYLFNLINQCKPLLLLDLRESNKYDLIKIRKSRRIQLGVISDADFESLLMCKYQNDSVFVFVIFDHSLLLQDVYSMVNGLERNYKNIEVSNSVWKCIRQVSCINFDEFHEKYSNCLTIFEGLNVAPVRMGLIKYFPTEIVAGVLFLGDYRDGTDEIVLSGLGITYIMDVTGECTSEQMAKKLGLNYYAIKIWDHEDVNISSYFEEATSFIETARLTHSKILVHCRAGISRSSTLVLAYLMKCKAAITLMEAYKIVVEQRPIMPNKSFRKQLCDLEYQLTGTYSFNNDEENMQFLQGLSHCWSGYFNVESDHDRTPVLAHKMHSNNNEQLEEYPNELQSSEVVMKPKKPFLRKGQGKSTVINKVTSEV